MPDDKAKKIDFTKVDYLQHGNLRQRLAFSDLETLNIMRILQPYQPTLTGTIPIGIDVKDSDLDIICHVTCFEEFARVVSAAFAGYKDFRTYQCRNKDGEEPYIIAKFQGPNFLIEIFGQALPITQQNSYRHMLIEHRILQERSEDFRREIIALKESGIKTEPAFAKLLGLDAQDPYRALLALELSET